MSRDEQTDKLNFFEAGLQDMGAVNLLVNSAYRGETSRLGWTTEADLLAGQRTDEAKLREMMSGEGRQLILMSSAGTNTLIGCVFLEKRQSTAYLGMLTVDPTIQSQGYGRLLLEQAELWARKNWKSQKIEMTVITLRTELIAWYERRGYRVTDERRPFPMNDPRYGLPTRPLEFAVLEKLLPSAAGEILDFSE